MPDLPQRIVLTGFMGSGKTTVGRALARELGWRFADLDDAVSAHAGQTVPEIFAGAGEAAFRHMEAERLAELLADDCVVIALGGGAPESALVQDLLQSCTATAVVHLRGRFEVFHERCTVQAADSTAVARPLLGALGETRARFQRREKAYAAIATYALDADEDTPDILAGKIARQLLLTS